MSLVINQPKFCHAQVPSEHFATGNDNDDPFINFIYFIIRGLGRGPLYHSWHVAQ